MRFKTALLLLLPLLPACRYRAKALKPLLTKPVAGHPAIRFAAKAYTKQDSKEFLGRDVLAHGYHPVQIAIENASHKKLYFSPQAVSMKPASVEEVIKAVRHTMFGRAMGYGSLIAIEACLLTDIFTGGATGVACFLAMGCLGGLTVAVTTGFTALPTLIGFGLWEWITAAQANSRLKIDYRAKALSECEISAHESIEGLLFISNSCFTPHIEIALTELGTGRMILCSDDLLPLN